MSKTCMERTLVRALAFAALSGASVLPALGQHPVAPAPAAEPAAPGRPSGPTSSFPPWEPRSFAKREYESNFLYGLKRDIDEFNPEYGKPRPTPALLEGPHDYGFIVVDAATGDPIPGAAAHGIILENPLPRDFAPDEIGNLETTKSDADGLCLYPKLPPGNYRFRVYADGYIPGKLRADLPKAGETGRVELVRGGSIKGSIARSDTGAPLADIKVEAHPPTKQSTTRALGLIDLVRHDFYPHYVEFYWATTDAKGEFEIKGVPEGEYRVAIPDLERSLIMTRYETERLADDEMRGFKGKDYQAKNRELKEKHWQEKLGTEFLGAPRLGPASVREGETLDLGQIKAGAVPRLELDVKDAQGRPLADREFEICLGEREESIGRFRTDAEGKAKLPLAGFTGEEQWVSVFVPNRMGGQYEFFYPGEPRPTDPLAGFDEEATLRSLVDVVRQMRTRNEEDVEQVVAQLRAAGESDEKIAKERERLERPFGDRQPPPPKTPEEAAERDLAQARQMLVGEKKRHLDDARRPEHPAAAAAKAKLGETVKLSIVQQDSESSVSFAIAVRSAKDGVPVREFKGRAASGRYELEEMIRYANQEPRERSDALIAFDSEGDEGRAEIRGFPIGYATIDAIREAADPNPRYNQDKRHLEQLTTFWVLLHAPGYAAQAFPIPLDRARKPEPIVLEMEPEAVVAGRVLLEKTGGPATAEAVAELLASQPTPRGREPFEGSAANVRLMNQAIDGIDPTRPATFASMASVSVDAEGRFELKGLRPSERWSLSIDANGVAPRNQDNVALVAGLNHLGDIVLGAEARLSGFIENAEGNPLQDVIIRLPMERGDGHWGEALTRSDAEGAYDVSLAGLRQDRQIVRFVAIEKPPDERDPSWTMLWFDGILDLDRAKGTELNPKLSRGRKLTVRLTTGALGKEVAKGYLKEGNWPEEDGRGGIEGEPEPKSSFKIAGAALLGLKKTPEGFVSHRIHEFAQGLPLGEESVVLEIDNVPPGRQALRIDGTIYTSSEGSRRKNEPPESPSQYRVPIGYFEFDMPATDHQIELALEGAPVTLELENPPADLAEMEMITLFERIDPLTTGLGGAIAQIMKQPHQSGRAADSWLTPMVSYMCGFTRRDASGNTLLTPQNIPCVPPGKYRVNVYPTIWEMMDPQGKPASRHEVEIKPGGAALELKVPYQPPPPRP